MKPIRSSPRPTRDRRPDNPTPTLHSRRPDSKGLPPPAEAPDPMAIAARIVDEAGRGRPADAVLRETLKAERGISAEVSRDITLSVFAYYRWFGWLDPRDGVARGLDRARTLDAEFTWHPETFTDEDLLARAVPKWTAQVMELRAAWLRTLQRPGPLWLRARHGTAETLVANLGEGARSAGAVLPDLVEYGGTDDLFTRPEFHEGQFEIQDLSSQWVGVLCAPQPGETWWDACAGEGGKTVHLSGLMRNKGLIWASDRAEWRLQKLKRRTARAGVFNYRVKPWDGGATLPTRTLFDGVLIDAPCSGLGTWHRNPHARWTVTPEDVAELGAVQGRVLAHAAKAVKPGGRLIYSVCTLTRAETDQVADSFDCLNRLLNRLSPE